MGTLTIQVLDGADRGRTFDGLVPPITIGREEGNVIQLNDERVSRFHLKIQQDQGKVILTDLDSTNGTRVNGEDTRLHVLQAGDLISVGRSTLLYGSPEEIAQRLETFRAQRGGGPEADDLDGPLLGSLEFVQRFPDHPAPELLIRRLQPPELPSQLSAAQAAQLAELLNYLHLRLRYLIASVKPTNAERVTLDAAQWQALLQFQQRLAVYLRTVSEPHESAEPSDPAAE